MRAMLLPALCLSACAGSALRVGLAPLHLEERNLKLRGGIAAGSDGDVFLVTHDNLVRYDPNSHSIEPLLLEGRSDLVDAAMTPDGVILVLCRASLDAWFAGKLITIVALPGEGLRISARQDAAYLLVRPPSGGTTLLRYSFPARRLDALVGSEEPFAALCAVRGGCLIAVGDSIYKLFEPARGGEAELIHLLAVAGMEVTSVAADEGAEAVYFADERTTDAWIDGRIVPLLPVGGRLAFAADVLSIASRDLGQVLQVVRPGRRARELSD